MQPYDTNTIMAAFDPIDQAVVTPPDLTQVDWDDLSFLGWVSPEGHRAFIVSEFEGGLQGMVLRRSGAEARLGGMCDLCYSTRRDTGTKMVLIDSFTTPRRSHGIHICNDLDCNQSVRGQAGVQTMQETISAGHRIERMELRLQGLIQRLKRDDP